MLKTHETFTIENDAFTVDAGVAAQLAAVQGSWRRNSSNHWVCNIRKADAAAHPHWKVQSSLSLVSMVAHLSGLPDQKYRVRSGDPFDLTSANLAPLDLRHINTKGNPDFGIQPAVGGKFRARAYVSGYQRALGTFDTIELARQARDEAIAHPERFPADRPVSRKTKQINSPRRARAVMQAEREALLARLKYLDLELAALK